MRNDYDKHDVTHIFQEKWDVVGILKDLLACIAFAAAVTVPFVIYLW
jgi:hypothetical protein